jgi:hypothetical protein
MKLTLTTFLTLDGVMQAPGGPEEDQEGAFPYGGWSFPYGNELQVHGSGALANTLIEHDLIDEYRLMTFPVHLGVGKKLFRDGARAAALRLVSSTTTGNGVVFATYQPAGEVKLGSFADEEAST